LTLMGAENFPQLAFSVFSLLIFKKITEKMIKM
jgi:hypothetical protein